MQRAEEAAKVIVENIQQIGAKRAEKWERDYGKTCQMQRPEETDLN
jgi:hypothetical protein